MEPSIFTKIINGELPCHKIYEDDDCIAFLDIHPLADGHTLVVPKLQIDHLWDLPADIYSHLWEKARLIAKILQQSMQSTRVGVVVEGFEVPHAHIQLVPINQPHELRGKQDADTEPDHEKLATVADKIRSSF